MRKAGTKVEKIIRQLREGGRAVPRPPETMTRLSCRTRERRGHLLLADGALNKGYAEKVYRVMDKVVAGTKFISLRPHQLWHSVETNWQEAGLPQRVIDVVLGHRKGDISDRYSHPRNKHILEEFRTKIWV